MSIADYRLTMRYSMRDRDTGTGTGTEPLFSKYIHTAIYNILFSSAVYTLMGE